MNRVLQQVIAQDGISVLQDAARLRERVIELGGNRQDAITLELMLTACPSIAPALSQGDLPQSEVNVLISSVVPTAGLSVSSVRRVLGALITASGNKLSGHAPFLLPILRKKQGELSLLGEMEDPVLRSALEQINSGADPAQPLSDLERLSQAGNAYASYQLGNYYHPQDRKNGTDLGRPYYQLAADLGYGPAYGALADYDINGKKKNLRRAAAYFEHPTALAGRDGRNWSANAANLLRYRSENLGRCRQALILSGLGLLFSFFVVSLDLLWGFFAVLLALGALGATLYSMLAAPYHSHRSTYLLLLICWLLAVAAML